MKLCLLLLSGFFLNQNVAFHLEFFRTTGLFVFKMADLEDKILKKNVPGRYSTFWHEEHNVKNQNEYSSHHIHHELLLNENKTFRESNQVATNKSSVNTGIKGILSDYRSHQDDMKLRNKKQLATKMDEYLRVARGSELKLGEQSISISSITKADGDNNHDGASDSDSEFNADDSILSSYRFRRFQELRQVFSFPSFGYITELQDADEFSQVIDDADSRVYCIFHLYDNSVAQSKLMNEHIKQIARTLNHCRFFRIEVIKLFEFPFDACGLPSLLVYKNGVEVANLTPITERFENPIKNGYRFTVEDIEKVLIDIGVCDDVNL